MAEKKDKNGGRTLLALALWLLAALVLFILFAVNQKKIASNLKTTDFFNNVFGKTPAFVENAVIEEPEATEKNEVSPGTVEINLTGTVPVNTSVPLDASLAPAAEQSSLPQPAAEESKPAVTASELTVPKEMKLRLFFMTINSDGSVARSDVNRAMKKSDTPLTDAINALITGPNAEESTKGLRSLVSDGTRLLGASVKDGIATLNFSSEFEFNQYGIEGLRGQLQQIVYTATAFPTVEKVQFLVDGEKRMYLGSEGVWIGSPLARTSF